MATPREVQALRVMEKHVRTKVKLVAEDMAISEQYARQILDDLCMRGRHVTKLARNTYEINPSGVDAVIGEYLRTLTGLERIITKHLNDERGLVEEIERLKLRKKELIQS